MLNVCWIGFCCFVVSLRNCEPIDYCWGICLSFFCLLIIVRTYLSAFGVGIVSFVINKIINISASFISQKRKHEFKCCFILWTKTGLLMLKCLFLFLNTSIFDFPRIFNQYYIKKNEVALNLKNCSTYEYRRIRIYLKDEMANEIKLFFMLQI